MSHSTAAPYGLDKETAPMQHASTTKSQSQSKDEKKRFRSRYQYWIDRGLTEEQARIEAANPTRKRRDHLRLVKHKPLENCDNQDVLELPELTTNKKQPCNQTSRHELAPTLNLQTEGNSISPVMGQGHNYIFNHLMQKWQFSAIVSQYDANRGTYWSEADLQLKHSSEAATTDYKRLSPLTSEEPSPEQIRAEIAYQKRIGRMIETTSENNASPVKNSIVDTICEAKNLSKPVSASDTVPAENGIDFAKAPYWITSLVCAAYLIHSMTEALGGGGWAFCIAVAFDITPILLVGARVKGRRTQQMAMIGAVVIFLTGLSLYLAPHIQTVWNELAIYKDRSAKYALESKEYEARSANELAILDGAKSEYDKALADYDSAHGRHGSNDWRTVSARKIMMQRLADWKSGLNKSDAMKKPEAPILTESLRSSIQELIKRIGLFASAFSLMFVMRRSA